MHRIDGGKNGGHKYRPRPTVRIRSLFLCNSPLPSAILPFNRQKNRRPPPHVSPVGPSPARSSSPPSPPDQSDRHRCEN